MESSEDDAGTATNASRRASAREKDVGVAEDVNATSSFQQKPSDARNSCQTPATSEENFDGDSVPSPSSQDVNTSTEAILDMIDEIVDGPDAPKRLQHSSNIVDELNEEFATTSYNLNIIQHTDNSSDNHSLPQETDYIVTHSENVASVVKETIHECIAPSGVPPSHSVPDRLDVLPVTSSESESNDNVVPLEPVSQPDKGNSNRSLPNIPSSSEEQTNQNVSESVCEVNDRTIKCVSSSDNRDNVTVESAGSTSSDSSVSESKTLNIDPQTRSPLRRRLLRPLPSDRRSDYTVSSTVDTQSVKNTAMEHSMCSENITKDVTSSSDVVPIIHGNVKPEEIRNVSQINFCQAETSMSPPKKIKLIRQKSVTGVSSRECSQKAADVLSEKDPCQSTSADSHSSLAVPSTSSSTCNLFQPQELTESPVLDGNFILEKQPEPIHESDKICPTEHSQPSIEPCMSSKTDSNVQESVGESHSSILNSGPPVVESESLGIDISTSTTEEAVATLINKSPKHKSDIQMNYLEQGNISSVHDNKKENRELDYIPLHLSPRKDECLSKSQDDFKDKSISSSDTELDSKKMERHQLEMIGASHNKEGETFSQQIDSKLLTPELKINDEEQRTKNLESNSKNLDLVTDKQDSDIVKSLSAEIVKLSMTKNDPSICKPLATTSEKLNIEVSNEPEMINCNLDSEKSGLQSDNTVNIEKSELKSKSNIELENCQLQSNNIVDLEKSLLQSNRNVDLDKSQLQSHVDIEKRLLQTHSNVDIEKSELQSTGNVDMQKGELQPITNVEVEKIEIQSSSNVDEEKSELQSNSKSEITSCENHSNINTVESENSNQISPALLDIEQKDLSTETKDTQLVSSNSAGKSVISLPEKCLPIDKPDEEDQKKVPPIKLNLSRSSISSQCEPKIDIEHSSFTKNTVKQEEFDANKQVPKLTIKLKPSEEPKSPVSKVANKSSRHPVEQDGEEKLDNIQQRRSVTKLNIKPILKPVENVNDKHIKSHMESDNVNIKETPEQLPFITKLNIKPIHKPPEKINDIHRKSSSSEISESEYSENDETTSTSDHASASDNGSTDVIPKVTIKLGKPGTECEGKFYTEKNIPEKNVPKLTIKGIQNDEKVIISQSEDTQSEKIPKLTIKTVAKTEGQPLSPKLTIKPLKPPDSPNKEGEIPKIKISTESFTSTEGKESQHVPKLTIKTVTRMDSEGRSSRKSLAMSDSPEHIPVVTKLNIKPIVKPTDIEESSEDKVPVVSKLNIKPIIKPKDNDVDSSIDDVPKITKLNIKPLKNPEETSSEHYKDCDGLNAADIDKNSIPVVTKINIKPIVKPQEQDKEKDSENLSSEAGNSSDENTDNIPVVTKLNIKPIVKPDVIQESSRSVTPCDQSIPVVTKLNIKPILKPGDSSPSSPKKEYSKVDNTSIPVISKLNIKPILRPEDTEASKSKDCSEEKPVKNPPLVMKINMKTVTENFNHENSDNTNKAVSDVMLGTSSKIIKLPNDEKSLEIKEHKIFSDKLGDNLDQRTHGHSPVNTLKQNCVPDAIKKDEETDGKSSPSKKLNLRISTKSKSDTSSTHHSPKLTVSRCDSVQTVSSPQGANAIDSKTVFNLNEIDTVRAVETHEGNTKPAFVQQKLSSVQNCTLLKKLLENTKDILDKKHEISKVNSSEFESTLSTCKNFISNEHLVESIKSSSNKIMSRSPEREEKPCAEKINDLTKTEPGKLLLGLKDKVNESVTKPLEIVIADKVGNQDSGQDSPRIILKINKTDHGASAKIITEDVKRADTLHNYIENTQDNLNEKLSPKKLIANSRRKQTTDTPIPSLNLSTGKRLRSSRIVENTELSQAKKNIGKRSSLDISPLQNKESELSTLQSKRLKLNQLLSDTNALSETPVQSVKTSPTKHVESKSLDTKPAVKTVNHSLLNSENCSKNGNSKLHNILSNLQVKQMQSLGLINSNCSEQSPVAPNIEYDTSISSSDVVEVPHLENSHPELQHMILNENADFRELPGPEDTSQDPLEVDLKLPEVTTDVIDIPKPVELTPQPKKRGRPRKLPVSEGAKPAVTLPVPALEERPQRSLRLMRDRPAILHKPRGRGRGRGSRRLTDSQPLSEPESITVINLEQTDSTPTGEIDPMSSRIKLPRMTEALDNMPSVCSIPLSSRRRTSSGNFSIDESSNLKVMLENTAVNEFPNTPEPGGSGRGRGRGSRGGRGRTPRGRGRGRGGGRGAMYMKETMGIYGRVCGPATTTVQLFEEETCMMDDNATPANSRPPHLLDDDSQSSVKSSTNESSKMKKSKFADLFDSNKVWTAADVKEYTWPPPDKPDGEPTVMMIQEQVAMFLGVKSFKRRYPELKRRAIVGEEREYVLSKGLVTEALCDLGITAVDASDVLDIMLSDYPHKYEEFRSHQRERQLTEVPEEVAEDLKVEEKGRLDVKLERIEPKPDVPKIDPEKTRLDMAAAAIASASEFNARVNASRRSACVDLQTLTVLRPRAPPVAPSRPHLRPPAGFYPHALLPGQYQHYYRLYTPEQLRYFPLNTVLAAPPAPASVTESSSDSEQEWGSRYSSSDDSDVPTHQSAKRKKLSKVKRVSQVEASTSNLKEEPRDEVVDTCRVCKLRLEANRKYTHERFLVCANCNAKLHPACLDLNADTIRKCREYPWQCAECKTCCTCHLPADDDKMLFCDLCDRGFHIYCVGLDNVPGGRWHCVECAICKSCGARTPGGLESGGPNGAGSGPGSSGAPPADWHHQTKRGPGGHKVYSHSLCTPCARAYRIGRYCPLCERSFIGPKGTMQLVICKLCDRQLHQECVKQSGATLRVMDYTCADCRRGGITSRAAAVRLAPRTIATLFMAKRRFNKYAHRQYMESKQRAGPPEPPDHSTDLSADAPELSADTPDLSTDAPDLSEDAPE